MIGKILLVLIMGIIFFSCSNINKSNIVNLDNLRTNEGWVDMPLTVMNEKKTNDYYVYLAKGIYKDDTLGITIKLKNNIPAGIVNGELKNVFLKNGIEFISNGTESDKLLQFMASKYGLSDTNIKLKDKQIFTCANLNQSKPNYKSGVSRFKIFLEQDTVYAELFVNFDFAKKTISFNEKDTEYRKPLIELLKE